MDGLMSLAEQHDLIVIEDCAQAHGASYKGRPVGGLGHIAAFSFCQDKIMTTGGEGGMLVTSDESIWRRAWSIKDHGKYYDAVFNREHPSGFRWLHESFGTNMRMTEMQAAIGRLQRLAQETARQRDAHRRCSPGIPLRARADAGGGHRACVLPAICIREAGSPC
jgi:dTDP-4-amino-4,6-dideoxygalactose transaminase